MLKIHHDTDLTTQQLKLIKPLIPKGKIGGKPRRINERKVINAILYILRTSCQWRRLPKYYPNWRTVYGYFQEWNKLSVWDAFHDKLRAAAGNKLVKKSPTAAVIDSQTVKTTEQADSKGYDAAKKIKGRKRHIVVDTLGLLLAVEVTSANITDRFAASTMIGKITSKFRGISKIWADGGYSDKLVDFVNETYSVNLEIVKRNTKTFKYYNGVGL